ncbi:DUF2637 domain-containing protein [Gordonia sp. VNK21]|uniref:DUF2637 domain-containing protein n=1 Tax=Gordonia sp. VNK21 TaxID=3382483 RepID=UPI0038D42B6E
MTTPTETYGRGLYAAALAFFSVLSVVGNAVYAYRAAPSPVDGSLPPGWAAAAHMIPPVALLLVTEVVAAATTRLPAGRARWVGLVGAGVIAAAAFALSFDALHAVAEMAKVRTELAWLVPVMLDVAIVVCTTLVLTASERVRADRLPSVESVGRADELDPVPNLRPAELTEQGEMTSIEVPVHRPTERPTTPDQAARSIDQPNDSVGRPDRPVAERPDRLGESPVDRPGGLATDASTDWSAVAERVLATTSVTADADDLAHVLALDAAGLSRQKIADEVGRAKSTIGGWIKAAESVENQRPALVAVSD